VVNIPKTNTTNSKKKTKTSTANRGLDFEVIIEKKCEELRNDNVALINKVPTEWKVLRRFNPKTRKNEIFSGFPVEESRFVDFIGIYNNLPIAMEAKSTKELTRFPFANIKESQINFLNLWIKLGGLGYYIIRFEEHKKIFMIEALKFHECMNTIGRKSAPYEWFLDENNAIELDYENINFIEYIKKKN
jgi:recombination protein U